jgi:hypothetical protein
VALMVRRDLGAESIMIRLGVWCVGVAINKHTMIILLVHLFFSDIATFSEM